MDRKQIINDYFKAWLNKDRSCFGEIFSDKIIYCEHNGAEYHGLHQLEQWFDEWNKSGTVTIWSANNFIEQDDYFIAEWYFKCSFDNEISCFDGVSIIRFDKNGKIAILREFFSTAEHYCPYED